MYTSHIKEIIETHFDTEFLCMLIHRDLLLSIFHSSPNLQSLNVYTFPSQWLLLSYSLFRFARVCSDRTETSLQLSQANLQISCRCGMMFQTTSIPIINLKCLPVPFARWFCMHYHISASLASCVGRIVDGMPESKSSREGIIVWFWLRFASPVSGTIWDTWSPPSFFHRSPEAHSFNLCVSINLPH